MTIIGVLTSGRQAAEALMLDAGTARRPNGGYVQVNGEEVQDADDLFDSPCKIQSRNVQPREAEVGERTSVSVVTELHLPVSTAALTTGDLFEVTSVHALSTVPVGTVYRVTAPVGKTLATARRYEVEEVVT